MHGYRKLFVAGGLVFSASGWVNLTLTIAALSLRLADHLTDVCANICVVKIDIQPLVADKAQPFNCFAWWR